MAQWFELLLESGKQAEQAPVIWSHDGADASQQPANTAKLLIYPRAGRVIACQMPGIHSNMFYHHQGLEDPSQAGNLLASGGAVGGDRLWIAPESAYMWKNLVEDSHDLPGRAKLPPAMDPADYQVLRQSDRYIELQTMMALHDYRCQQSFNLRVRRAFEWVSRPSYFPKEVSSFSFAIQNELTLVEVKSKDLSTSPVQAGCWDLLQLPAGGVGEMGGVSDASPIAGWLICPTLQPARTVRSYYEPCESHVLVKDHAVLFKIDAKKRVKIGLKPEMTTGQMGYYRQFGALSSLIVRQFLPCLGQAYIDMPVDEILTGQRTGGDALQAYNHNDPSAPFGEMEYHDPAVLAGHEPLTRIGRCITHVLAGLDQAIVKLGSELLGVNEDCFHL